MSEITPELTIRLTQIEAAIVPLWNGIESHIENCHTQADLAVRGAWETGKLLNEAKTILGSSNFKLWREKMEIPESTSSRYMKLNQMYLALDDMPSNRRASYLAIGLLPDKDEIDHGEGNVTLKPSKHHLTWINKWNNWLSQVKIGKITVDESQFVKDADPLYQWLKGKRREKGLPL